MRRTTAAAGTTVFFALAPGVVAGLVPWWLTGWRPAAPLSTWWPLRLAGALLVIAGAAVLVHAFARFVTEGLGTPAPVAPTSHLVVGGLYRYVRNPMYLAVTATILGQALLLWRPVLLAYAAIVAGSFVVFVLAYEQPMLRLQFGPSYEAYRRAVPAWWPRLHAWNPTQDERTCGPATAIHRLATYGTLAPGRPNHHQLDGLDGRWIEGQVYGTLVDAGWGASLGYPALVLNPRGRPVGVLVFESADLPAHWSRLDQFEGPGYQRVTTIVHTRAGDLEASVYTLRVQDDQR